MDRGREPANAFTNPLPSPSNAPDFDLFTGSFVFLLWDCQGRDEKSQEMKIGVTSM